MRIALLDRAHRALLRGVGGESERTALLAAQRERCRADERARRHAALAQLGERALATTDLDTLLSQAARVVAQTLGVERVEIFEILAGGGQLSLRAATVPGGATAPSSTSLADRAVDSEGAVGDVGASPEAGGAALAAAIRAPGQGSAPYGVLEARASEPRSFDDDDAAFLVGVGHMMATAILRLGMQDRLARSLQFMQAVTGHLAEGVLAVDRERRITFVNAEASRMLGWPAEELLGRSIDAMAHRHDAGGSPCTFDDCPLLEVLRTGVPYHSDSDELVRRDCSRFPASCSSAPLREDGETSGAVITFEDFSEHLSRERDERFLAAAGRELGESIDYEVTLRQVARTALPRFGDWSLVVVLSRDGTPRRVAVEAADPAMRDTARELLERYPIDLRAEHGVGRVLRTGEPELIREVSSFVGNEPSAAERRALLERIGLRSYLGVPLRAHGRILGAMAFGISVPGRRFTDGDLALAEDLAARCGVAIENATLHLEAQTALTVRDDFLAIVSHDLKAPLATVMLGAHTIEKLAALRAEGDAIGRCAGSIRRSADRMHRLIADLLDLAALQAGQLAVVPGPVDLAAVAREASDDFRDQAAAAALTLEVAAADGLPPAHCDRGRVLQVLSNLLANAIQATGTGGRVTLRVEAARGEATVSVSDTGPGVSPEELPRLFERFWRGQRTRYAGSGLGLAIAKAIVDAHQGRIWAESRPGEGATFRFTLPLYAESTQVER